MNTRFAGTVPWRNSEAEAMRSVIANPIRAVVVEDQDDPRELLLDLLRTDHPHVEVVGTAADPARAVEMVRSVQPDLLFLDIGLPDHEEGFGVLEALGKHAPYVIVTTAATGHALKAIKLSATDYLVKPVDPMELRAALDKASAHLERDRHVEQTNQLLSRVDRFGRLRLPTPNGFHLIPVHEIVYCESAGNYSTLVMSDGVEHAITRSLGQLEEELNSWFLRIHRCHLVNLRHVRTYLKGEGGQVVMSTGKALDVSRTKKQHLLMALAQDGQMD